MCKLFVVLKCRSEMIMGFAYEYTHQDCENIIRMMNTKHAQLVTGAYQASKSWGRLQVL